MKYFLAAMILFSSLNADEIIKGETKMAYGFPMSTWAVLDDDHQVKEAGFNFYIGTIKDSPVGTTFETEPPFVINFPPEVQKTTFLNHLEFNWRTGGHPPHAYQVAHTDMHFYTITAQEVSSIDCTNTTLPTSGEMPPGFILLEHCEKAMGYHAFEEAARKDPHQHFSRELVLGYYKGKLIFIEAMASKEFLLSNEDFTLKVPVPDTIHKTLWPTKIKGSYKKDEQMYQIALTDFVYLK